MSHFKQKAILAMLCLLPTFGNTQEPLVAGANINMVSGTEFPGGDPFLQRQNEPSLAVSTRNPLHLLAGANDYRTVDIPGLTDGKTVGDSWPGVFTSVNGGGSWVSTLIPGFPQDNSPSGVASPLKGYEAGADPVIRAGTNGLLYYSGIVFDRGDGAPSAAFVSRFMDLNNDAGTLDRFEDSPIRFIDTQIIDSDPGEANTAELPSNGFIDKPWLAVDIPRPTSQTVTLRVPQDGRLVEQTVDCGPLYIAYAQITGEDTSDIDSHIMFTSSYDCGEQWTTPFELDGDDRSINQGTSVAINPNNGDVFVSWRQFNQATLQCTRGGDFWETNPGEWPVERFMLGGVLYNQQQALEIMAGSQNGNPWRLAREMIVAKLNLLSGLNDKKLAGLVEDADAWLIDADWVYEGSGNGTKNTKDKTNNGKGKGNSGDKEKTNSSLASELAGQIELFNDGVEGPGDCSTFPSGQGGSDKPDAIMMAYSTDFGKSFSGPVEVSKLVPFDQGTTLYTFRNNSYPTMAVDDIGRVYIAWSTRNRTGEAENPEWVDSRVVIASSLNGRDWTEPNPTDYDFSSPFRGHQIQPSLAFSSGKLMMIYLDFRQDRSAIFERYIADVPTDPPTFRHTVDVRVAIADPASAPLFSDYSALNSDGSPIQPTTQLSRYFNLMLKYDEASPPSREQLQFNPLNQPLFKGGTVPFIGDYIDLAPSPSFLPNTDGTWRHNTGTENSPIFHAAWSDNRDVRGPPDGDWTSYVPPENIYSSGGTSLFDSSQSVQACVPGVNDEFTGMRNQNIYTSRITQGLYVGIPANAKPLRADLPRTFVLFAKSSKNTIAFNEPTQRTFTLRIVNQPEGGKAAFNQSAFAAILPEDPITEIEVMIGRNSSTAKTIYATSTNPNARIEVEVIDFVSGLRSSALINPDPINPAPVFDLEDYAATVKDSKDYFEDNLFDTRIFESLENGSLLLENILDRASASPDGFDLLTQSLSQLALTNPDLFNPGIYNPGIYNPGIYNPGIYNPGIYNPGIYNPGIYNPGIYNPGIYNPGIYNPGIYNPGIYNTPITDVTYTVENTGDTASAYDVNIALDELPVDDNGNPLYSYQLIVSRFSTTPVPDACQIIETPVQEVLLNNTNPDLSGRLVDPSDDSFYLSPGDTAVVTLRIIPILKDENSPRPPPPRVSDISIAIVETSVDEEDFIVGDTQPDVEVVLSDNIAPLAIVTPSLPNARGGLEYTAELAASGGKGAKTWNVIPGSVLPEGLQLASSGTLFGIPLSGGSFGVAVRVSDDTGTREQVFPIEITAPPELIVSTLSLSPELPTVLDVITISTAISNQGEEEAQPSTLQLTLSAGESTEAGLVAVPAIPAGDSVTVEFEYSPRTEAQEYSLTAVADFEEDVVESEESNNSFSLTFTVSPPPFGIATESLPDAFPYFAYFPSTGGYQLLIDEELNSQFPQSWSLVGDALPGGLTLLSFGRVSGIPNELGEFTFRARVDIAGNSYEQDITLRVFAPKPEVRAVLPTSVTFGQPMSFRGENLPASFIRDPQTKVPAFREIFVFEQNGQTFESQYFAGGTPNLILVSPPSGLDPGPATVRIGDSQYQELSDPIDIVISSSPTAPLLQRVISLTESLGEGSDSIGTCNAESESSPLLDISGPAAQLTSGQFIAVSAYGITFPVSNPEMFSRSEVIFEQGSGDGLVRRAVRPTCYILDRTESTIDDVTWVIGAVVQVPATGFESGNIEISIRQLAGEISSPDSNLVVLPIEVITPPEPLAIGNFYEAVEAPGITWIEALEFTGDVGGYLATITSEAENSLILSLFTESEYWIGGFKTSPTEGASQAPGDDWNWINSDGCIPALRNPPNAVNNGCEGFSFWGGGEPNNAGGGNETNLGITPAGWNDEASTGNISGYMVEYSSASLPNGFVGAAYANLRPNIFGTAVQPVWSVVSEAGSFVPGLVLNSSTGEISGTPTVAGDFSFVIEVQSNTGESATLNLSISVVAPRPNVVQWTYESDGNGHWYEYVSGEETWAQAEVSASNLVHLGVAGHLVTITSAAEQAFVNGLRTTLGLLDWRPWIGLSDSASEGNFVWVTSEPLQFVNWGGGEPSNSNNNEDYVELFASGAWNDITNNPIGPFGYLVEYDSP